MLVTVAEVVLAELAGLVALCLEQFGDGNDARLKPFLCPRELVRLPGPERQARKDGST